MPINDHRVTDAAEPEQAIRRDGFALPMAIVVLALLTMGLVAGFAMTSSELSTTASQRAQARAYTNAQVGLETFLTRRKEKAGSVMFCPHCWAMNASAANGSVAANLDGLPTRRETVTVAMTVGAQPIAIVRATPVWVDSIADEVAASTSSPPRGTTPRSGVGGGSGRTSRASRTVGAFVYPGTRSR